MEIRDVAKICHQANKAYCEGIGDTTQLPWALAKTWQVESAIAGVQFLIDNPQATPRDTHDSWMKEKIENGWTYGLKKDEKKKTHHCMVNYDELPLAQRLKDSLFIAIVDTFRNQIGHNELMD